MKTSYRNDKRVNPELVSYRFLTNDECRRLSGHADILDGYGKIAHVKVTSVKTWKTRSDVEVNCKFGLYEYFTVRMSNDRANDELVQVIDNE